MAKPIGTTDLVETVRAVAPPGSVRSVWSLRKALTWWARPPCAVPAGAAAVFHELAILGAVPVIAHPERNGDFVRDPGRLAALVARGALVHVRLLNVVRIPATALHAMATRGHP